MAFFEFQSSHTDYRSEFVLSFRMDQGNRNYIIIATFKYDGNLKRIRYVWCIDIMVRVTNNNSSLHIFFKCNKLTLCLFPLWIRWSIPSGFVKPQPIVFDRKTMAEKCNNQGLKSFLVIKNTMMEWNVAWIILLWLFILN